MYSPVRTSTEFIVRRVNVCLLVGGYEIHIVLSSRSLAADNDERNGGGGGGGIIGGQARRCTNERVSCCRSPPA